MLVYSSKKAEDESKMMCGRQREKLEVSVRPGIGDCLVMDGIQVNMIHT